MQTEAPVYDLSEPDLWRKPWFQAKLIAALSREGHAAAVEPLKALLADAAPASFEDFKSAVAARLPSLAPDAAGALDRATKHLDSVIAFNRSIYFPQTP